MNEKRETATITGTVSDSCLPLARALRTALEDLYQMQKELGEGGSVISERYCRVMDQARVVLANTTHLAEPEAVLLRAPQ